MGDTSYFGVEVTPIEGAKSPMGTLILRADGNRSFGRTEIGLFDEYLASQMLLDMAHDGVVPLRMIYVEPKERSHDGVARSYARIATVWPPEWRDPYRFRALNLSTMWLRRVSAMFPGLRIRVGDFMIHGPFGAFGEVYDLVGGEVTWREVRAEDVEDGDTPAEVAALVDEHMPWLLGWGAGLFFAHFEQLYDERPDMQRHWATPEAVLDRDDPPPPPAPPRPEAQKTPCAHGVMPGTEERCDACAAEFRAYLEGLKRTVL